MIKIILLDRSWNEFTVVWIECRDIGPHCVKKAISRSTCLRLMKALVWSIATYGCKCWTTRKVKCDHANVQNKSCNKFQFILCVKCDTDDLGIVWLLSCRGLQCGHIGWWWLRPTIYHGPRNFTQCSGINLISSAPQNLPNCHRINLSVCGKSHDLRYKSIFTVICILWPLLVCWIGICEIEKWRITDES